MGQHSESRPTMSLHRPPSTWTVTRCKHATAPSHPTKLPLLFLPKLDQQSSDCPLFFTNQYGTDTVNPQYNHSTSHHCHTETPQQLRDHRPCTGIEPCQAHTPTGCRECTAARVVTNSRGNLRRIDLWLTRCSQLSVACPLVAAASFCSSSC